MDILIPTRFDRTSIIQLLTDLDATRDLDNVVVDFSRLRYSTPTAMLVAGSKLRKWHEYRQSCGYQSSHRGIDQSVQTHSYLMHLGFFDFVHINEGRLVGEARGSTRYLPITHLTRPPVDVGTEGVTAWYDAILDISRGLAAVVAGAGDDSEALRTYSYCIREIIRNVFEHAQVNECFICAQRWANGQVEIVIVDDGVGLAATLMPDSDVPNDETAIRMSVRPGITRTGPVLNDPENIYGNSGFGLFVLTELAASFGWFVFGSGSAQMTGHRNVRRVEPTSFQGTYFGLHLNAAPHSFSSVLADIISSGEEEAGVSGISRRASGMSRFSESHSGHGENPT